MVTSTSYVSSALNGPETEVVQVTDKTGTFRGIRLRNNQIKIQPILMHKERCLGTIPSPFGLSMKMVSIKVNDNAFRCDNRKIEGCYCCQVQSIAG